MKNVLSKLLVDYRQSNGLSQAKVAEELGITQANVSRIESGDQLPSAKVASGIRRLILTSEAFNNDLVAPDRHTQKQWIEKDSKKGTNGINLSFVSMSPSESSGDVVEISKLAGGDEFLFLVGDAVGHGTEAGYMAFGIRFGFHMMLNVLRPEIVSPVLIESALETSVHSTSESWVGPPSVTIGKLNCLSGDVEIINAGNPSLFHFRSSDESIKAVDHKGVRSAIQPIRGAGKRDSKPIYVTLEKGDSLLCCTDGMHEALGRGGIKNRFAHSAKIFKGQSERTLWDLMSGVEDKNLDDDLTALIISMER